MRMRIPKSVLTNLNVEKGKSEFDIYYDRINEQLILKVAKFDDSKFEK